MAKIFFQRARGFGLGVLWRCIALLCGLCLTLIGAPTLAQVQVNPSFSPSSMAPAATSILTLEVVNNTTTPANSISITNPLPTSPAGLVIGASGLLSNSCGGSVSAVPTGSTITLSGGSLPAAIAGVASKCTITVQVVATPALTPTSYVNTVLPANVSSSIGGPSAASSATLSVLGVSTITGAKTFTPANIHGLGTATRLRLQLNNTNSYPLTGLAFTNTLVSTLELAASPAPANSCGGTLVANPAALSFAISEGTVPSNSNCVIELSVVARTPTTAPANATSSDTLAANAITTTQGAKNGSAITGTITVQKAAAVALSFSPPGITVGGTSTMTFTLTNYNASAITNFNFSDAMPNRIDIVGTPTTNCPGATVGGNVNTLSITGGTLAAAPVGVGSTSCTITATVTSNNSGNYNNSVPAGTMVGVSYSSTTAALNVSDVGVTMAFNNSGRIPVTGVSTMTITLQNRNTTATAAISSFTHSISGMGAGVTLASTPSTTNCGGALTAVAGATSLTLSGGSIPIATNALTPGTCTLTIYLQAAANAAQTTRTNTIAANSLQTSFGNNTSAVNSTLRIDPALTPSASFSPSSVGVSLVTRLTVTITRAANAALFNAVGATIPLPSGMTIAPTPNPITTCTSASVTATPGLTSFNLTGGTLGTSVSASAACTIAVNVVAPSTAGSATLSIPIGNVTASTSFGALSNVAVATTTLNITSGFTLNNSFSPSSIAPGGTSRLTVLINNQAAAAPALTGFGLNINLPAGLVIAAPSGVAFTSVSGTCTGTPSATVGAGVVSIAGASVGAGALCALAVDVTSSAVGTLTLTLAPGLATTTQGLSNTNTTSASLLISGNADLSVSITDGVTSLIAGNGSTYVISITNASSALSVAGLPVVSTTPAGASFVSWTCSTSVGSSCLAASGTGPINTSVTLLPSGTAQFSVSAQVNPDNEATSIAVSAAVDPTAIGVFDPVGTNNSATDTNSLTSSADLRVTQTISNPAPPAGSVVTFDIEVINDGPSTAKAITLSDTLPGGYTLTNTTASQGTVGPPNWSIGTLGPGGSATLQIEALVNATGDRTMIATATGTVFDPNLANNSATIAPMQVGVTLLKSSTVISDPVNGTINPKAIAGAIVEYRLTVQNEGSAVGPASIIIKDMFPAVDAFVSSNPVAPIIFIDGPSSSGLNFDFARDVTWTSEPAGSAPFSYVPAPDGAGFDGAVTGLRINPKGAMASGTLANPSRFELVYRVRLR